MQICKSNTEQKQIFGEELENDRTMMEHDGTIAKANLQRRGSRATVIRLNSCWCSFKFLLRDYLIGEGYLYLCSPLQFFNKILALFLD